MQLFCHKITIFATIFGLSLSALSVLYLVFTLPIAFILHDAEEVIVQHRWMLTHRDLLVSRFPKMRPMIEHLSGLGTRAFAIAAMEELIILIIVTCYVLVDGLYSTQIWSALFIAFSIHLFIHLAQAIIIKGYVPGFITSLLLLPYSLYGIHSIWLVTSGIEFFFLSVSGMAFIAINLRFAHWIGNLFGK